MTPRACITGVGTVGAAGLGRSALSATLAGGTSSTAQVELPGGPTHPAALLDPGALRPWLPAGARRMSPPSRHATAAASMAVEDAGLADEDRAAAPSTAVVLATTFGPMTFSERIYRVILDEDPEQVSPAAFTECVANAPAAQVAIARDARGPNVTVTQREAGALLAVARGAELIRRGQAARALVGVVNEMNPLLVDSLSRLGALAPADADGIPWARPFDRRRAGVIAADGATVLVLEEEEAAASRGARVLARVRGSGGAFDASAGRVGWGAGHAVLGAALRRVVSAAQAGLGEIDRVVSGASGAVSGDRLEALTLQHAWRGADLPPVLAPKAVTGEHGGGFLAAAVLALDPEVRFGPTRGFAEEDPELGLVPHDGAELPAARTVLATSLAAGGAAAWLVLERA